MRKAFITKVVGLFILAIAFVHPAHASHTCEDYGLKPVGLFANGESVEAFVAAKRATPNGVADYLEELKITLSEDQLADLLQAINKDPVQKSNLPYPLPTALRGIGGFATSLLLERLIFVRGRSISEKVFYGKIRDYTFIDKTKSGHLSVDTCIDDRQTGRRDLYHWDIVVDEGGFTVKVRDDNKPDNPFNLPSTFQMPEGALDETNRHSIWYRGLDHKLGAMGTSIKVINVYHRQLNNDILQNFPRIDNPDPNNPEDIGHLYYTPTPESCIDLFTRHFPPATFGELAGNGYCLGRCAHPAIYNSGD